MAVKEGEKGEYVGLGRGGCKGGGEGGICRFGERWP